MFIDWKSQWYAGKMSEYPSLIKEFNYNQLSRIFKAVDDYILKLTWKNKRTRIGKIIGRKKDKVEDSVLNQGLLIR